ncbi:MAG: hypothetical protein HY445_00960 [Candidatus Niyogibacteria bacterium]|nr:hypothetical protein [Candidatus Niyogibacteria bacterium]
MSKNFMQIILQAGQKVFGAPFYAIMAIVFAVAAFLFAVWLPNIGLISDVFTHSSASLGDKLRLAITLLGSIRTNFSFLSATYTILIALLFGINITMIAYYLKQRIGMADRGGFFVGLGGMASGVLGIGCAACGSFILTAMLSFIGASGSLALLPFNGGEFGFLSIVLLSASIFLISRKITNPLVCRQR